MAMRLGGDDERNFFLMLRFPVFERGHQIPNQIEAKKGFTTLEFDFHMLGRTLENEVYRFIGNLSRHVVGRFVKPSFRNLAVPAPIVTPKCRNDHEQTRQLGQGCLFGSVLDRKQLKRQTRRRIKKEVFRLKFQVVAGIKIQSMVDEVVEHWLRNNMVLTTNVG